MPTDSSSPPLLPEDLAHLRRLAVGHYALAALVALVACLPLIHLTLGALILSGPLDGDADTPALAAWTLTLLPGLLVVAGWTLAGAIVLTGRSLARRRRWAFCMTVEVLLALLLMPLGTLLGGLTLVVLLRPQVQGAFGVAS